MTFNTYELLTVKERLAPNPYPGRGIILGKTPDGKHAVFAYFIMGRSENSRNRIFTEFPDGSIRTEPYDASEVKDPSLIIYAPVRSIGNHVVVTNGDQTDTVVEGMKKGLSFSESLTSREFEPDAPNLTPRISGILNFENGALTYDMSILKSADPEGSACNRFTYSYASLSGVGHFIHTYMCDGNPLPTFSGEPERTVIPNDIDEFANEIWSSLNEENKISLAVRYYNIADGGKTVTSRLFNKYSK
jgi:hypothetical protein